MVTRRFVCQMALVATAIVLLASASVAPAYAVIVQIGTSGRFVAVTNNAPTHELNLGELEAFTAGLTPNGTGGLSSNEITGLSFESQIAPGGVNHGLNTAPFNNVLDSGAAVYTLNSGAGNQLIYDLGATHSLGAVRLWARADVCCSQRLSNFTASVLADNGGGLPGATVFSESFGGTVANNTFAQFSTVASREIQPGNVGVIGTDVVNDNRAGFLRVQNNGTNWLAIGEIEVFASGVSPSAASGLSTNEMTGFSVESVSAPAGLNHGTTPAPFNNTLDSGSPVFTLSSAAGNEYLLDLNGQFDIGRIRIFNRADCCQDRLANYTVSLLNDNGAGLPGSVIFSGNVPGQTPNTPNFSEITVPSFAAAYTLRTTDSLVIDIDPAASTADLLSVGSLGNGALAIQPGADLVLNFLNDGLTWGVPETFNILDFASATGSFSSITINGVDNLVVVDTSNLLVNGQITALLTPEPASIGLGAVACGIAARRKLRN